MPWAVLLSSGHAVDVLARDLLEQVQAAGPHASAEQVDRLVGMLRLSHGMSESAIRLGLVRLLVKTEEHQVAATRAVLLGCLDALLGHLGASDQPEAKLWAIRSFQAALSVPELAKPRAVDENRHPERGERAAQRLDEQVAAAAAGVPWPQDVDLVITTRSELAELARLRQQERERQLAVKALAAAPHRPSVPVMAHPDGRMPWRIEDVEAPVLQEIDDEDAGETPALVGRIVPPWDGPWNGSGGDDYDEE